jgi:hypothetical protein
MNWIAQRPQRIFPDEQCPAFPYELKRSADEPGFFAILTEADAVTAIHDQVNKLEPEFDRSSMSGLHRLLWLLNDTNRYKSIQAYLGFMATKPERFYSEVLIGPFDAEHRQFIIDLKSIEQLATEFLYRLRISCSHLEDGNNFFRIWLTPIKTNFGQPPKPLWGFSLSLRAEAVAESKGECVRRWIMLVSAVAGAFERTPAATG